MSTHKLNAATKPRALITGASEGIGREIARQLAEAGYTLTLVARNKKRLAELLTQLPGVNHRAAPADLSLEKDVSKIAKILLQGNHDLLVNNAGSGVYAAFAEAKEENLLAMMRLNMEAPLRLARAFLTGAKPGHKILNIGSVLSYTPLPGNSVYAASKSFVASWSEALWHETREKGIWVGVYCPGYTKTLFSQRALAKGTGERPEGHPPPWLRLEPQVVAQKALRFMNKARGPVGTPGPGGNPGALQPAAFVDPPNTVAAGLGKSHGPRLEMKPVEEISRVNLTVDLSAVSANFKAIAKKVAPAQVMAVLKANAYGLGVMPMARALVGAGAHRIGVAELKEARVLGREFVVPIHILSGLLPQEVSGAVALGLRCPVTDLEGAKRLSREAVRQKKKVFVHFKVDTGMGRMGFPIEEARRAIGKALILPGLVGEGLMTHFASANHPLDPLTKRQTDSFLKLVGSFEKNRFPIIHMANSDGINNFPGCRGDLVRTGINLYGVFDLEGRHAYRLKPTLSLKTQLIAKRFLPLGHPIGYGSTHILKRDSWVGTLPAGYADGLPLALSNRGEVLVKGRRFPVIGRVSMDYTTVDLTEARGIAVGDEVTLIGKSRGQEITVEDWARLKGTHPYEIICALGPRVARVYKS